ncbi:ArsR/SmtB family transcription factor [Krasilnikovia sp. M28-CT-15]|uniref:ArsR/SmtB family transcription factor n=1 Tax=Krasilnikovia sp. M28-CT-15 TaxID=3373540 RepID=UPI0038774ABA
MIRIEIDERTVTRTRIAISPLTELIAGLFLLQRSPNGVPWPYDRWSARAWDVLRNDPAAEPVHLYFRMRPSFPDLFVPLPTGSLLTLTEELEVLRAIPAEVVEEQFAQHYPDGEPDFLRPFRTDPAAAFGWLADGLAAYWDAAVAPYWPAVRAALEEEVLLRAQALAARGPDALLTQLHDQIIWRPPFLTMLEQSLGREDLRAANQRLLLVPLIFAGGSVMASHDNPNVMLVGYQARGAAVLSERPPPSAADSLDRLALLIGRGRAALLRALTVPATTTGLAAALGLAPSTVSEHLSALQAAGVVQRRRAGRRVLYGLEPTGRALLNLLDSDTSASVS